MSQPLVKCVRKYKAVQGVIFYWILCLNIFDICQLNVQCHGILTSGFFHESVSPKPLSILLRAVSIFFENLSRYSQLKVHAPNGKNFQSEKF
jgi:hypothetical protein